jgi:NAD(P) transhydrogenase subunit alpha
MDLLTEIAILVLAAFVGFQVISKVPNTLHTPLMSGTNAIHGIVLLGGLVAIAHADGFLNKLLIVIAITFGTINIVGGFLVTDRMLSMFKRKPEAAPENEQEGDAAPAAQQKGEAAPAAEQKAQSAPAAEQNDETAPAADQDGKGAPAAEQEGES